MNHFHVEGLYDFSFKQYPELIFPEDYVSLYRLGEPEDAIKPTAPPPLKEIGIPMALYLLLFSPILIAFILCIVLADATEVGAFILIGLVSSIILFIIIWGFIRDRRILPLKYYREQEKEHLSLMDNYHTSLIKYGELKRRQKERQFFYESYEFIDYLRYLLKDYGVHYLPPIYEEYTPNDVNSPRKGPGEEVLFEHISKMIRTSTLAPGDFTLVLNARFSCKENWGNAVYYPDIVLQYKQFVFDIEVDEPYVSQTGQPIHCKTGVNSSSDDKRNYSFTKNNWIVIRFSEEQVFKYPNECWAYILMICKNLDSGSPMIMPSSATHIICDKWDINDARRMAMENYRLKYLPQSFAYSIKTDTSYLITHTDDSLEDSLPF